MTSIFRDDIQNPMKPTLSIIFSQLEIRNNSQKQQKKWKCARFSEQSCLRRVFLKDQLPVNQAFDLADFEHWQAQEQKENHLVINQISEEVIDTIVATKCADGPSQATITTQKLFQILKQTKKISRRQVMDVMGQATRAGSMDLTGWSRNLNPRNQVIVPCDQSNQADNQGEGSPSSTTDDLTQQVISHLRSLASRIDINGKASLLPCATTLDRRYLPIIRFLLSCVKPAASGVMQD
jgi:hypothetical protein